MLQNLQPEGWWKINVDASFKEERAALAMVARYYKGMITSLDASLWEGNSAHELEVAAILKATGTTKQNKWTNLVWDCDD